MTDLAVKLDFFNTETTEICPDCGCEFSVNAMGKKKERCDACADKRNRELASEKKPHVYHLPEVDFAKAVITKALIDCKHQDPGAIEFVKDEGIELWLRSLGLNIRPSMSRMIREKAGIK